MLPSLSAGSGPAAAIIVGFLFYLMGKEILGIILIAGGFILSLMWSGRFR